MIGSHVTSFGIELLSEPMKFPRFLTPVMIESQDHQPRHFDLLVSFQSIRFSSTTVFRTVFYPELYVHDIGVRLEL